MAINFPDSPSNADTFTANGKTFVYNSTNTSWRPQTAAESGGTDVLADMAALIAKTGMSNGDQALVQSNNNLYMYSGSGWYKIATIQNDAPSAITGVDGSYSLAIDGTATIITAVSTDPEGFALTWSYTASGLGSIATVSQAENVFTVTPSTDAANAGSFTLTISATDGINGAVSTVPSFALSFIVTNSRYTALSVKATATGSNQTFDDASSSNHTITVTNDTKTTTFSPYRHGGYSAYFDGSGDYLTVPDHADFNMASENFTAECWIYPTASPSQPIIMGQWSGSYSWALEMSNNSSRHLRFLTNAGGIVDNVSSTAVPLNQWSHVALVRNGTSFVAYLNGTSVVSSTVTAALNNSTDALSIGASASGSYPFQGYISDARLVKGTAAYTSNFTPPTEPLTAVTNTKFLLGDLPYFKDQSTSNHAITVGGDASLKPFSSFDNAAYSEASHGASAHFDGTGDRLTIAGDSDFAFGTGDFSISCWIYFKDLISSGYESIIDARNSDTDTGGWQLGINSNAGNALKIMFSIQSSGSSMTPILISNTDTLINQWYYISVSRTGTTSKLHLNGTEVASNTSDSTNYSVVPTSIHAGSTWSGSHRLKGYLSDIRVVKGTAVYTANYTPPTAPLTAITNTKFLLNPETSISDLSQSTEIKCVGNVATSTTQVKFAGTKSIAFDGAGDYLVPSSTAMNIPSSTEFTIEGWVYFTGIGSYEMLFGETGTRYMGVRSDNNTFEIVGGSSNTFFPWTANNNIWYYITVVRNSSNIIKLWIDGVEVTPNSGATNTSAFALANIGRAGGYTSHDFQGYMQDVRITKGLARYTANFTPPTAELEG